jgi:glyoxylase-like metal-dependent hydrolase (beta-lactamase superfamily II)
VQGIRLGFSPVRWVEPFTVCLYYVDGLLVDTAQRHMQREVGGLVEKLDVRQIFLTHHHEDHTGNARYLHDKLRVPVYASELTAQRVGASFRILPYEQFWFGRIEPCSHVQPMPGVIHTERYRFEPIHTPGHCEDHYLLHEPDQGWLLAGDFYIGKLKVFRRGEDIGQHIESARKVLALDFDAIFCAHNPVFRNGKKFLQEKLGYLEALYSNVAVLYHKGLSEQEIQKSLSMKEATLLKWLTCCDVSVRNIISSVIDNESAERQRLSEVEKVK